MAMRTILVLLDFSDDSHQALRWGASLAERYGASLLLLHVLPKAVEEVPNPASTAEWVPYGRYVEQQAGADSGHAGRLIIDLEPIRKVQRPER
jgi:nucleotide-binding universal stress UspA family protein